MIAKKHFAAALAGLALALLGVCGAAVAQEPIEGGPRKGAKSLNVFGSITNAFDEPSGVAGASLGVFVTDQLEAGPSLGLFFSNDNVSGMIGADARYNFGLLGQGVVPYVSLGLATDFGDNAENDIFYAVAGGARFFLKPQQAFFIELQHLGTTGGGDDIQNINFGLTFFIP